MHRIASIIPSAEPVSATRPTVGTRERGLRRQQTARLRRVCGWLARHVLLVTFVAASVPTVAMAITQPVWARNDEAAHTDMLAQFAHGTYPVLGQTPIRPETLSVLEETGVFRWDSFESAEPVVAAATFSYPPALSGYAKGVWAKRHSWEYSTEAIQPPLYYAVATPIWMAGDAVDGPLGGIYAARLLNALLLAALAPITAMIARRLWPRQRGLPVAAGLVAVVIPGVAFNLTSVTNDTLVTLLGAVSILLAIRGLQDGWAMRSGLLLGGVYGAALLTKSTAFGLVPALAFALLYPQRGRGRAWLAKNLAAAVAAGAVSLGALSTWLFINLRAYGALTAFSTAQRLLSPDNSLASTSLLTATQQNLDSFLVSFVGGEPAELTLTTSKPFSYVLGFAVAVAIVGLVWLYRRRSTGAMPSVSGRASMTLLLALAGSVSFSLALPLFSQNAYLSPGRYAYPALAAFSALLAAGLWAFLPTLPTRVAATIALAAAGLATVALYPSQVIPPRTLGSGAPPASAAMWTVAGRTDFHGFSIAIDQAASGDGWDWVHVVVRNTGAGIADWTPITAAHVSGKTSISLYAASTHLWETIASGQAVNGWLALPRSTELMAANSFTLDFPDVSTDGYANVAAVTVNVARPAPG